MDYSDLYKSADRNKCSIMDLLPLLIDIDTKTGSIHVTPSCFMNEMQLSTEQRLEKLSRPLRKIRHTRSRVLRVQPDIVIFQNFKPGTLYTVPLKLLNVSKLPLPIRIKMAPSAYFSMKHATDVVPSKIATGMTLSLEINFSADDFKDYNHEIFFATDVEAFDVKLIAIGPRPLLDLPDKVTLPITAINVQTERTLLVRNVGQVAAKVMIETSAPFTVDPIRDTVRPESMMQLTVYFTPTQLGYVQRHLKLRYETGEVLSVIVEGVCEEAAVTVSKAELSFKETFLQLTTREEIEIRNESNYNLQFKWKRYPDVGSETDVKEELKRKYADMKDYEVLRDERMDYFDVATEDANRYIYGRILSDEQAELQNEDDVFFFNDDNFVVRPMEGELWPHSRVNVSFIFAPKYVDSFERMAYLQVTGLLNRQPIKISAQGKGPQVNLNVDEIDVQNIYIRAVHRYKIIIINSGPISANISYMSQPTTFGGVFGCSDEEFSMLPNSSKCLVIEFSSEVRGKFTEDLQFVVQESGEVLRLCFTGSVICPMLCVDVTEIDFKHIPIGHPKSYTIRLRNPCQVPIEFAAIVPEDGDEHSYSLEEIQDACEIVWVNENPMEFTFEPESGEVEAYGELDLTVNLVSNHIGVFSGNLMVCMWSSRQYNRTIPVKYVSKFPEIFSTASNINMKSMFIRQPYCRVLILENRSTFPGYFVVECQTSDPELILTVNKEGHFIEAHEKLELRVTISTESMGTYTGTLSINQFGSMQPEIICNISVKTRGPSVDINCDKIIIGEIPTLTLIPKIVPISNDSPIPAKVSFSLSGDFVSIAENHITMQPEEQSQFTLQVYGTLPGPFKSLLRISVENGDTDFYPVSGTCLGGSILCEPRLDPMLELGVLLTENVYRRTITLTNKGDVSHSIYFSQHAFLTKFKGVKEPHSVIVIEPNKCDLHPNEAKTLVLSAMSKQPLELNAIFYMHTKADRQSKISVLQFYVQAVFEEPTIAYTKNSFEFHKDVTPDDEETFLEDTWGLLNCTNTELLIRIVIDKPFYMIDTEEYNRKMLSTSTVLLRDKKVFKVVFEPPVRTKRCFVINGCITIYYKNHPKVDKILLEGKVNYATIEFQPNYLDFECLPENTTTYMLVLMKNVSPIKASFEFKWLSENYLLQDRKSAANAVSCTFDLKTGPCVCMLESSGHTLTSVSNQLNDSEATCTSDEVYREKELVLSLQHLLIPLVDRFVKDNSPSTFDVYRRVNGKGTSPEIHNIVDVVPTKGYLEPFECQYMSVSVRPVYKQLLDARLTCHVAGGEIETLTIRVKSGDVSYNIQSRSIDMGIVQFNMVRSKTHMLENTGCVPFFFSISHDNIWYDFKPVPRWLNVNPQTGYLKAEEKVYFTIDYFPGVAGYFHEKIRIDVGYEDTIELDIVGCAIFPQVSFDLPRPEFESHYMNELSYSVIGELMYPEHLSATYVQPEDTLEPDLDSWVTLTPQENMPSPIDVSMALERRLIRDYLLKEPVLISACFYNPTAFIPVAGMPHYIIDLGYVAVDSEHQIDLLPVQYKPSASRLMWLKLPKPMTEKGFKIFFTKGNSTSFLLFKPPAKHFKASMEHLQYSIYVIVFGGLKLEIQVRAVVARPQLFIGHSILHFGRIKCGYCLKKTIVLHNSGYVPCDWSVCLVTTKKRTPQFYLHKIAGHLEPDEKGLLDIYFEPRYHGKIVWKMIVSMPFAEDMVLILSGYGMEPKLEIVDAANVFNATLPYSNHNKIVFTVTNRSPYPLEMYFLDFDRQSQFEVEVIWTIFHYYNVQKIYTRPREPGDSLPDQMVNVYNSIVDRLRQFMLKLIRAEYRRQLTEVELNSGGEPEIGDATKFTILSGLSEIPDPLQGKTFEELKSLLTVNMDKVRESEARSRTSFQRKVLVFDDDSPPPDDATLRQEGVLVIFHGAPDTPHVLAAYRTGRLAQLPVANVDNLIMEALLTNQMLAAIKINEEIDKRFNAVTNDFEKMVPPGFDAYDELCRKIEIIQSGKKREDVGKGLKGKGSGKSSKKSSKKSSNKSSKKSSNTKAEGKGSKTSSKKSKSSSKASSKKDKETFLGLSPEYFSEIIRKQVAQFKHGLVIESLSSIFVKKPHVVLATILSSVGNIRYIQGVYYSYTHAEYLAKKKLEQEQEQIFTSAKRLRVLELLDMDHIEFDNVNIDDLKLFKTYVLEPRRILAQKRALELKMRLEGKPLAAEPVHKKARAKASRFKSEKGKEKRDKSSTSKSKSKSKSRSKSKSKSKSSSKSSKSSKKSKGSGASRSALDENEQILVNAELEFYRIKHILEYWDRKNEKLLKPIPDKPPKREKEKKAKAAHKPPKAKGKSTTSKKDSKSTKDSKSESLPVEPPKIQVKMLTSEEVLVNEYTGVPLMVLSGLSPPDFSLPQYLNCSEDFMTALELLEKSFRPQFEESEKLYTTLQANRVKEHDRKISDVFVPYDFPMFEGESMSSKKNNSSAGTISDAVSSKSSKRSRSHDKSETSSLRHSVSTQLLKSFTPRLVLQPQERVAYEMQFLPKKCGEYYHTFPIAVVGCAQQFLVQFEGKSDIPKIYTDPEMLFPNVLHTRDDNEYSSGYIENEELFTFGPVLAQSNKDNPIRCLFGTEIFNIISNSYMPCIVTTEFLEHTDVFSVEGEPHGLLVHPNNSEFLPVNAHPTLRGLYEMQLLLTIRNNPAVFAIKLACVGSIYEVELVPGDIVFERVLLGVRMQKDLVIRNKGKLAMNWRFVDNDDVFAHFMPSARKGLLKPQSKQVVKFDYMSMILADVPRMQLQVDLYDKDLRLEEPFISDIVQISAEMVDIRIEYLPDIDLHDLKVGIETFHMYKMINKSKYELKYSFTLITNYDDTQEEEKIKSNFTVETSKDCLLKVNHPHEVKLKFHPKRPVDFDGLPVFRCAFYDVIDSRKVHSFDLKISATVFGSNFELCPPLELNFGHQLIQTEAWKEIILRNNGKYNFTFAAVSMKRLEKLKKKKKKKKKKTKGKDKKGKKGGEGKKPKKASAEKKSKSKSKSKSRTKSKSKSKSMSSKSSRTGKEKQPKVTTLKEGIFTLVSSTGKIEPDGVEVIKVFCKPNKVGDFEEEIVFYISESFGKTKNGQSITLRAKGCIPNVEALNYPDMFKEIRVVEAFDDVVTCDVTLSTSMFAIESKELSFRRTCLNLSTEIRMMLHNSGLIGALASCKIMEGDAVFDVQPRSLHIEPYKSAYFTITFLPLAIEKFHGILEILVYMDDKKYRIKLSGEGCLPEIAIIDPQPDPYRTNDFAYAIHFNPLMIGTSATKDVSFKNTGLLPCKVLAGIQNDDAGMLFLVPKEYPVLLQKLCEQEYLMQEFSHTVITELKPGEVSTVQIQFKPNSEEKIRSTLKIYIINNPFEVFEIPVTAEGFKEDIIIEGLETTNLLMSSAATSPQESMLSTKSSDQIDYKQLYYDLNFGYRFINKLHKMCFKMKNISAEDTYKFAFSNIDKLTFVPATGHLKPFACKEIIVAIYAKCPLLYDRILLQCKLCKIRYLSPEHELLSWDERQHFTIWEPVRDTGTSCEETAEEFGEDKSIQSLPKVKIIKERTEPPIEIIAKSEKTIKIYFSVVLDYCSYSCDTNDIDMEDTLLFEKRTSTFQVTNTSYLPINLKWNLVMDENFPRHVSEAKSEVSIVGSQSQSSQNRPRTSCPKVRKSEYLTGKEKFLNFDAPRPKSSHSSESSGFSATTEGNVKDSWSDFHLNPFTIEPQESTMPPGEPVTYTVTFSPFEVFEYAVYAHAIVPNLKPGVEELKIFIKAKSVLPLYHFNIRASNYLSVRHESKEHCGFTLNENTKIVEFESVGVGVPSISKFTVVNPTGEDFSYKWECGTRGNLSLFQCQTPEGFVTKGKMAEASFAFVATKIGVFEALYVFFIEKYNLRTDFLLVGKAREPCVYFKRQSVIMKPTVIGIDIYDEITLRNDEEIPLKFNFKKSSLYSEGRQQKIVMVPFKGVIGGKTEESIRINFSPSRVGPVTFNVECKVEKLEKPLALLIEGNCYEVQPTLSYLTDFSTVDMQYTEVNDIELAALIPLREDYLRMKISNVGNIGLYYKWTLTEKFADDFVKLNFLHREGYVKTNTLTENTITIKPLKHMTRKSITMCLKISYGPTYNLNLLCSTCRTKFKLSFKEFDFGPCLMQSAKTFFYETALEITNNDPSPVSVDTDNELYEHLTVVNKANMIYPKKSGNIVFYFHPFAVQKYRTEIPIFINGKCQRVTVLGEGVPLEVELVDPGDKLLNFGPVGVGRTKRRFVKVVNMSKCTVSINFDLLGRLAGQPKQPLLDADFENPETRPSDVVLKKKKKKKKDGKNKPKKGKKDKKSGKGSKTSKGGKKKDKKSSEKSKSSKKRSKSSKSSGKSSKSSKSKKSTATVEPPKETPQEKEKRLIYQFIKVNPTRTIKLSPGQVTEFTLTYSPTERMPLFSDQVFYQVQYEVNPICMFKSCCLAPEYYLDQDKISFGTVIKGCSTESFVKLFNIGDIGGRYKWNISKKMDVFSIRPMEGYITPNMTVMFTVNFFPTHVHCMFRTMAQCMIDNFKPLNLELLGTCINLPPAKETLKFLCPVRQQEMKSVTLKNPTGYDWIITPSLSGQYFTIESSILVKSTDSLAVSVTYKPLTMTLPNRKHESKLFFPLPEGQGIMYNLIGESTRPTALLNIESTITAKSYHTEHLLVANWMQVPQQFSVINQIEQPNTPAKVLYKLSGNSIIDVPPMESRIYKWIIYPLNDGKLSFKVKFRNMATGEYILYEIMLTVTKCVSLEMIHLTTHARQMVQHKIMLQNPIKQPAVFTISSTCPDLHFKGLVHLDPYTTEELVVEYAPIVPISEYITTLEAKTTTLGTFPYTFVLTALPACPEAMIQFQAQLGLSQAKTVYLYNFQEKKADFTCRINDPQFRLEQNVSIPPKEKGPIQISFEPDNLGGFHSKIILTSPTLGEFIYPLVGSCTEPKPIGPFVVKEGSLTVVPFKNPFDTARVFYFSIEPALFTIKNDHEYIRPKMSAKIYVAVNAAVYDKEFPVTGKVFVTCQDEDLLNIKWTIYVKSEKRVLELY